MLGQWRMVLRQAEEAARAGRYDEALLLASRPDVADHQHAVQFRSRMALELVTRAARRAEADDIDGAIEDLELAERLGAPLDTLAAARLSLGDRVSMEIKQSLEAGDPSQVVDRVEALARRKIGGPALRRAKETAEAWTLAIGEGRRGEFGRAYEALDRAERLAGGPAVKALAATRKDLDERRKAAVPRVESLYTILAEGEWSRILAAADAVLELIPEHPAARQARQRAWQQIAAIGPAGMAWPDRGSRFAKVATDPSDPAAEPRLKAWFPPASSQPQKVSQAVPGKQIPNNLSAVMGPAGRFILWVDTVGGYLVCLDETIVIGRAGADSPADIPLLGDLSRRHATLTRDGDGYVLKANHTTFVNGREVDTIALRNGDVIRLGDSLELEFHQPSPVSATARLMIVSRHRMPLAVDGVILMAETCILGSTSQSHVPVSNLAESVVLYRHGLSLWCRSAAPFEVDGKPQAGRAPLTSNSHVLGEGISFSLEELASIPKADKA